MQKPKGQKCKREVMDNGMTFNFIGAPTLVCRIDQVPQEMLIRLAVAGINHTVGDSFANSDTPADAFDDASARWDAICSGSWTVAKESGGGITIEALSRLLGKTRDECKEAWNGLDEAAQKVLAKEPQVAAMVAKIKLERAEAKVAASTGAIDLGGLFAPKE